MSENLNITRPLWRADFDKPSPQDEARLRELLIGLQEHGRVLVMVDQPNTIGALRVAVAPDCGATMAHLPGLAMSTDTPGPTGLRAAGRGNVLRWGPEPRPERPDQTHGRRLHSSE